MFYECLDLMSEQRRNARLDPSSAVCRRLLSLFSQSSFFFTLFFQKMKSILNNHLLNDEWSGFLSITGTFMANTFVFVLFWMFSSCWPLLDKQWISDWCLWRHTIKTDPPKRTGILERPINCVFTSTQLILCLRSYLLIYEIITWSHEENKSPPSFSSSSRF